MTPKEAEKLALALALGPDHPLVTLANEFSLEMTGKYPSWCCQKCGKPKGLFHKCYH